MDTRAQRQTDTRRRIAPRATVGDDDARRLCAVMEALAFEASHRRPGLDNYRRLAMDACEATLDTISKAAR